MKRHLLTLLLTLALLPLQAQQADTTLADGSRPPAGYRPPKAPGPTWRPWVRWWWNGDKVEVSEIVRELHVLKEAGIGGVEINPIEFPSKRCDDLDIPSLTWLSDEWIEALGVALREAKSLGMGCDLLVGSGWPFGTETLPMEDRAQVMLTYAIPLPQKDFQTFRYSDIQKSDNLNISPSENLSNISKSEYLYITKDSIFRAVDPKVTVPNPDRTFELVSLKLAPDTISSLDQIIDLPIPKGDTIVLSDHRSQVTDHHYLYALVRVRSFACVINGAPGAAGSILDHMKADAVQRYLDQMSTALERKLGPMKNWLRAYFVDSMELEGCNWTDDFAEEFLKRRGYDLMPWLPFTMFKVGRLGDVESYEYGSQKSPDFQQRLNEVRHDFELTKAELLHERYTQTFLDWCHKQGVKARAQAYGRGFFPLESSLGYDIPEGESWTTNYLRHRVGYEMPDDDYRRGRAYTMINKYVSSAAHLAGNRLVSAEEMTNTYMLFNTPLELLKLGSDMNAITGITHSVWHGFNYSPPEAGFPGWVQYGSYLNEKNTWWPYFHLLNEYRARMSALLQNADMQTDIAIVPPTDQLWAQCGVQTEPFPNYPKGSIYEATQLLWEAVHKNGGNCDLVPAAMADTARIVRGTYRCGCKAYRVLLLPQPDGITLRRPHKPDVLLPLPDSNHYLEWYAQVQQQYQLPHAVSIDKPDRFLLQSHYKSDQWSVNCELTNDGSRPQVTDHNSPKPAPAQFSILNSQFSIKNDLFLFLNAHIDRPQQHTVTFPRHIYRHRAAWLYDCNTGERSPLYIDKEGRLSLSFAQSEMKVVIFNNEDLHAYRQFLRRERRLRKLNRKDIQTFRYSEIQKSDNLNISPSENLSWPIVEPEHWQMHLHHAVEGWDTVVMTDTLCDLRSTDFPHFAGTITYTTAVTLEKDIQTFRYSDIQKSDNLNISPSENLYITFTTDDIAEVSVNGRHCATIWHGERQCLIPSQYLRAGDNTIEIKVTTLLNNYVHTLTDDKVIQHFVLKRNIPTYPSGLRGQVLLY